MVSRARLEEWNSCLSRHSYVGATPRPTPQDYEQCERLSAAGAALDGLPHLQRWHAHMRFLMARLPCRARAPTRRTADRSLLSNFGRLVDDDVLLEIAADWAERWADFRGGFEFDDGADTPRYSQLLATGLSATAANIFKNDPALGSAESAVLAHLRRFRARYRYVGDLAFTEEEQLARRTGAGELLTVVDLYNPACVCPNPVAAQARQEIVDGLVALRARWAPPGALPDMRGLETAIEEECARSARDLEGRIVLLEAAIADLRATLSILSGRAVTLVPFGSFANGLLTVNSDVDCWIQVGTELPSQGREPENVAWALVRTALRSVECGWGIVKEMKHGRGPVITVAHSSWPDVEVDLSFAPNSELSVEAAALFRKLLDSNAQARSSVRFLKQQLRSAGLVKSTEGGFSTYAWLLMVLSALTDAGAVPPLRGNLGELPPRYICGWNVASHSIPADWHPRSASAGALVLAVLAVLASPSSAFALTPMQDLQRYGGEHADAAELALDRGCVPDPLLRPAGSGACGSSAQRAAVLLCAAPITFRERSVLAQISGRYGGELLNIDEICSAAGGHKVFAARLTEELVVQGRRLLVLVTSAQAKRVRLVAESVPPWVAVVVLLPVAVSTAAVQWSVLQNMARPEEVAYRGRYRDSLRRTHLLQGDFPAECADRLDAGQHRQFSVVLRDVQALLSRCLETPRKLDAGWPGAAPVRVPLHKFWTRAERVPDDIERVMLELLKYTPTPGAVGTRVVRVLRDLLAGRGFFAVEHIQADPAEALAEAACELDRVLPGILSGEP